MRLDDTVTPLALHSVTFAGSDATAAVRAGRRAVTVFLVNTKTQVGPVNVATVWLEPTVGIRVCQGVTFAFREVTPPSIAPANVRTV